MKYTIFELQDAASMRNGVSIEAKNLADAKRKASRAQMFCGTVLVIESAFGAVLAVKDGRGWNKGEVK